MYIRLTLLGYAARFVYGLQASVSLAVKRYTNTDSGRVTATAGHILIQPLLLNVKSRIDQLLILALIALTLSMISS